MSGTYILSEKMVLMFSCAAASGLSCGGFFAVARGVFRRLCSAVRGLTGGAHQIEPECPRTTTRILNHWTTSEAPENAEDGLNHSGC